MRRRIQMTILAISYWLLANSLYAQVNSDSLIQLYSGKMKKYLDKEGKASEVFTFTKKGIEVYVPATDTSKKEFEFLLNWNKVDSFKNAIAEHGKIRVILGGIPDDPKPQLLRNCHIVLDPGHISGDLEMAKMEKKWVDIKNPPVQLIEGELTLATALILKKKLESQGATVMLTRDKPNISSFGIDFTKWLDSLFLPSVDKAYARGDISFEEKDFLLTRANNTEIFRRFFLQEDLRERARKINEFNPDMTLVIHYNVDETNASWNKPTKKDYNMTFVGGSFMGEEFSRPEDRIDFLRLLLTDDMTRSIEFSKYIIESMVKQTGIPAALDSNAIYLRDNCMKTYVDGVYCRNLTLTRKVKGVICYGESLYQDNINECKALSKKDASTPLSVTNGLETSKRVEEVVDAYFQGIMNYVKRKP